MRSVKNPVVFQGRRKKKDYFEGWYYKNVSLKNDASLAFIPGISLSKEDPHSFVQVIKSNPIETQYYRYDISEFEFTDRPFKVKIGENIFTESSLRVDLKDGEKSIRGRIDFSGNTKIKKSLICPNIMGFFAYLPNMECNHGIVSMNHSLAGRIDYGDVEMDFDGGKGYIEKDWGRSFPKEYIWMQANSFKNDRDSFMVSVARIPFMGMEFNGVIANLCYDGKEYRFATYNRTKILSIRANENSVQIQLEKGSQTLTVTGKVDELGSLKSPNMGDMVDTIKEGLSGTVQLELKEGNDIVAELQSHYAGIEISGYLE